MVRAALLPGQSMACEIISCEGAVFVLWGKPTVADVERVMDRLELIAEKTGRRIGISLVCRWTRPSQIPSCEKPSRV